MKFNTLNLHKLLQAASVVLFIFTNGNSWALPEFSVPKNDYLKRFGTEFVAEFCKDDEFLTCFNVKKELCIASAKSEFNFCTKNMNLPDPFEYFDMASKYEEQIGGCVGSGMANKYRAVFKDISACKKRDVK